MEGDRQEVSMGSEQLPLQERVPPPSSSGNHSPNLRSRPGHHSSEKVRHSVEDGVPTVHSVSDDDEPEHGHPKRKHVRDRFHHHHGKPKSYSALLFEIGRRIVLRHRVPIGSFLFILYLDHVIHFKRRYINYFGAHPIHGGTLGVKWDRTLIQKVIDQTSQRNAKELADIGVVLPVPHRTSPSELLQINTNAALREFLIRRETRARHLIGMEDMAEKFKLGCGDPRSRSDRRLSFLAHSTVPTSMGGIPKHLLLPDWPSWPTPRPGKPSILTRIPFDGSEMRHLIEDYYLSVLPAFDSLNSAEDRTRLWAICALHFYGGIFLGIEATKRPSLVSELLEETTSELFLPQAGCGSPKGFALFHGSNGTATDIFMVGATPRNPHLRCVLNTLEKAGGDAIASQILSAFYMGTSWKNSQTSRQMAGKDVTSSWERLSSECYYGHAHGAHECCQSVEAKSVAEISTVSESVEEQKRSRIYVRGFDLDALQKAKEAPILVPATVDVREREGTEAPLKSQKASLEKIMTETKTAPGWLCCRCLKTPLYGSIEKCSAVCNAGFARTMCDAPDERERTEVTVEVTISRRELQEGERRIPRIVHQTWFEELSPDRYPQLVRLQESWMNSGWDYRFYTDEQARQYIVNHFPLRFVDAFDSLIPGAYKADLFRYLVLMKEGGIYADVDIMLDATLDSFIEPSMTFFAPRDVVGEYADEPFCLWNGVIGAAPGHPFIVRTVERLVGLILQRADMYDMEQDVCRRVGRSMENWKVRAEPLLLASGPCALGVAVNDVLQRSSLARFDIGWITSDQIKYGEGGLSDHGDALIMVGDKYDLGSFRISDPERNLLLASTDLPGVTKDAREIGNPTRSELLRKQQRKRPGAHYSEAARGEFVWGAHNVYHDDYVNDEILTFDVVYN